MTVDSSALLAILFAEAGHLDLVDRILEADVVRIGAPTLVETTLVLAGRRPTAAAAATVESLIREPGLTVVAFGEREHEHAVEAFLRFGRGRHAAGLNFGIVWPMRRPLPPTIACCSSAASSPRPTSRRRSGSRIQGSDSPKGPATAVRRIGLLARTRSPVGPLNSAPSIWIVARY
jgi:ribonuclease VapC